MLSVGRLMIPPLPVWVRLCSPHSRAAIARPGMLQLHCGVAAAVELGSSSWPISLMEPGAQRPGGVRVLVYAGSLEVFYHEELFPLAARTALDQLCGLRSPAYAGREDAADDDGPPGPLDWAEVLRGGALSDSSFGPPSDTSSAADSAPPRRGDVAGCCPPSPSACGAMLYSLFAGVTLPVAASGRPLPALPCPTLSSPSVCEPALGGGDSPGVSGPGDPGLM